MKLAQSEQNRGHEVVESVIYGPVHSRRYGNSLGINLLAADRKICTFNCVYCQLGWTDTPQSYNSDDFVALDIALDEINHKLAPYLSKEMKVDNVVVSGNGEPTLHPHFKEITRKLVAIRDSQPEKVPLICFTNATQLDRGPVLDSINLYDECCVKIDADVRRVGLPKEGFDFLKIKKAIATLSNLVVQSCFMTGSVSNIGEDKINEWMDLLEGLCPKRIDLYTLSRNTPNQGLLPVKGQVLTEIANKLRQKGFLLVREFA